MEVHERWLEFDRLGVEEVRKRLGSDIWGEGKKKLAREWVPHRESLDAAKDRAIALDEARAENEVARAANPLAQEANEFARAANETAEATAVSARDTAFSARASAEAASVANDLALAANATAEAAAASARRSAEAAENNNIIYSGASCRNYSNGGVSDWHIHQTLIFVLPLVRPAGRTIGSLGRRNDSRRPSRYPAVATPDRGRMPGTPYG
jgi:hypothetical protein